MPRFCYKCGAACEGEDRPGFKDTCETCMAYLYSCRNCTFFEEKGNLGCSLTYVERVTDLEKYNYCDEFKFRDKDKPDGEEPKKNLFDLLGGE